MSKVNGYAAQQATTPLAPFNFERREPRPGDVQIEILYCGVCHSDLHTVRNEWKGTIYPVVPGHEIVGKVMRVGKDVTTFKPGDVVAVGCMVDFVAPVKLVAIIWSNIAKLEQFLPITAAINTIRQ